jgi:hypothetical protein
VYEKGRLKALSKDTNADGKPDLWEKYDASESLTKRTRDLNFDGEPDVEEPYRLKDPTGNEPDEKVKRGKRR